jgi:uncharacterized membrane protein
MGLLMIFINVIAVMVNYGKTDQSGFAVVSLIAAIFSYGIFINFKSDPLNAPNYAVWLSTGSGLVGIVLLITGLSQ